MATRSKSWRGVESKQIFRHAMKCIFSELPKLRPLCALSLFLCEPSICHLLSRKEKREKIWNDFVDLKDCNVHFMYFLCSSILYSTFCPSQHWPILESLMVRDLAFCISMALFSDSLEGYINGRLGRHFMDIYTHIFYFTNRLLLQLLEGGPPL